MSSVFSLINARQDTQVSSKPTPPRNSNLNRFRCFFFFRHRFCDVVDVVECGKIIRCQLTSLVRCHRMLAFFSVRAFAWKSVGVLFCPVLSFHSNHHSFIDSSAVFVTGMAGKGTFCSTQSPTRVARSNGRCHNFHIALSFHMQALLHSMHTFPEEHIIGFSGARFEGRRRSAQVRL